MTTATAPAPASPRSPIPAVTAVCDWMATDWSPWHVVLYGLTWADYDLLLAARAAAGRKRVRITYDRGTAEIWTPGGGPHGTDRTAPAGGTPAMTVGNRHERWKKLIARLLEAAALAFRVPLVACGNVTLNRGDLDRGLEPDECYYVRNAARVAAIRELDLRTDPPPDLAIEVEVSRTVLDRLDLYASLGVAEVWRFDGERVTILTRSDAGTYAPAAASLAFPQLTPVRLEESLARAGTVDDTTLCLEFIDWVRSLPKPPTP